MNRRFNPPPHWPEPPSPDWTPPPGWRPSAAWGPVPAGWRLWIDENTPTAEGSPFLASENVPPSGSQPRPAPTEYPRTVLAPGQWQDGSHAAQEDRGEQTHNRPRTTPTSAKRRIIVGVIALIVGFLIAAGTASIFVRLVHVAHTDLPAQHSIVLLPGHGR